VNGVGRLAKLPSGRRTKWLVVVFWVAVLAVAGPLAGKLTGVQKNDTVEWLPQSAESTQVFRLSERFQSSDVIPAVVVYERSGAITPGDLAAVTADKEKFAQVDGVVVDQMAGPIPAQDGQALQLLVPIDMGTGGWERLSVVVDEMRGNVGETPAGLERYVTGPAGVSADFGAAFEGIDGTLLYTAGAVVIIILLLTYRSPVLWMLPVVSAVVALTSAQAVIYLLARYADLTVNAQSQGILTVLVFGAGTDYALLLVARYREELRRHEDRHEAMAFALHRAGPAIFASAATVALGMLVLLAAEMNSTKGMGPVAAIGVAVGLLAMVTLLPALLVIMGRWVFWPVRPTYGSVDRTATGVWARIGALIARRPRLVWITTSLVLAVMALGLTRLDASGLSNEDAFTNKPESIAGSEVLAEHFDAGSGDPVVVISKAEEAAEVRTAFASVDGISQVTEPVVSDGYAFVQGTLAVGPDTQAARDIVTDVRAAVHAVPDADALVGGSSALVLDSMDASARDNVVVIPLVLLVVFVILALLLRALVAPILLIATVVLSFLAALGVSTLVYDYLFGFNGADPSLPLWVFVFLVALGIDYNIFLMTRVHEEAKQVGTRRGALIGLAATGGVITSAGLVLAGTFAALATLPMVMFVQIGFAVAFGVLLDTIIVRAVLVTSLNLDVGRWMWWPSKLAQKRDVEPEDELREPVLVEK
jgi:putative drug exporter of the RND superfamily